MPDQVPAARATPDLASLGSYSDLQSGQPIAPKPGGLRAVTAALIGVVAGCVFMAAKGAVNEGYWESIPKALATKALNAAARSPSDAQHQAEYLLQQALNHDDNAVNKIVQQAGGWSGKI